MKDILGKAALAYHRGNHTDKLWINNKYGPPEEMPLPYFFRDRDYLPKIEHTALMLCTGTILDVGAGVGTHSIILQDYGQPVTALEISPLNTKILEDRGVKNIINQDVYSLSGDVKYDTLLFLMNGIGLAQTITGLEKLLIHLKTLLKKGGQILFDSCDINYLFEELPKPEDRYYGEIDYQYEFNKEQGDWFKWLYIDFDTMKQIALESGYVIEKMDEDDEGHYLCRLTLPEHT